ncbi:hypothetical protein V8E52_004110, partial [Russula decolorans]
MTIVSVRVGSAVAVMLCVSVSDVSCRSSIASSIFILMASTRDESVYSLQVRPYQTASQSCRNIPGARWLSIRICKNSLAHNARADRWSFGCGMTPVYSARSS